MTRGKLKLYVKFISAATVAEIFIVFKNVSKYVYNFAIRFTDYMYLQN
jgi:hypothetical protein